MEELVYVLSFKGWIDEYVKMWKWICKKVIKDEKISSLFGE